MMNLPNEFLEAVNGKGWSRKSEQVELGWLLAGSASLSYAKLP
jgi:hypothetical protein